MFVGQAVIRHHSAIGSAAWTDLLRSLKDSAISGLQGSPKLKKVGAKAYWYDHYRLGNQTVDRYIGEDSDELRARLSRQKEIGQAAKALERERARLMRVLRAEGYLMPDGATGQAVSSLARTGVFRLGGTLVGTQAFRCYEGELGVRIGFDQSAMTDDIDIASFERLSLALGDRVDEPLERVFSQLKFDPVPGLDRGKVWKWRQTDGQTLIEFLNSLLRRGRGYSRAAGARRQRAEPAFPELPDRRAAPGSVAVSLRSADPGPEAGALRDPQADRRRPAAGRTGRPEGTQGPRPGRLPGGSAERGATGRFWPKPMSSR